MKKIDNQILEEIARYNSINQYIVEQDATLPPPPGEVDPNATPAPAPETAPPADPNAAMAPPAPTGPQPVDIANDPDVEKIGGDEKSESKTEEMDITDLVKSQKKVEEKQEEYFNNLFQHLDNLVQMLHYYNKLVQMLHNILSCKF